MPNLGTKVYLISQINYNAIVLFDKKSVESFILNISIEYLCSLKTGSKIQIVSYITCHYI